MVQNSDRRPRGRPRAYDPDRALAEATRAFWDAGYAATSLDDLSAATGMNRPSLYGAFGDKRALYVKALQTYRALGRAAMQAALAPGLTLRQGLERVYASALAIYLDGDRGARGCFLIGTAATEAVGDPEVRQIYADGLHELDAGLEARFRRAQAEGEIAADADPAMLARLACAVMHSLSLRARAGEPRAALEATAAAGVALLCPERASP